ncbi:nucleotidyltransferase [Leucobacter sp. OLJS4]|uniref:nucleotidyltransferase domain-containing protein n=1 Tax=unclassified Leucobacter TaxID=2621730 RepID=UPI000C1A383F|nr:MULTISPECIES: nucleotidyltransferase domain-containing protein [unclassified Leucobacter]PII84390.1 nucleotidyltransferase [Leucobacter sp. OLCALW19]PII91015.1 nucleotidyltransferase [Leucobacter sp. OLAS13]PII95642.1 nucleotidyltransferase [Leucobacter sp. OLTLW20]PII96837.1 nucleotidyltransferase [Leucobacter sp. OLCS4]PII98979.1 nucleotidyltransferase [Leucobacter sp. OLDS2]
MRTIPDSLDPQVVAGIDARLSGVEREHGVRIPWAIESGSRAWGFPSPDSDYDCRFLYVRPSDDYLSLWPGRDVIETPLDRVFDVNGWDLAKAVKLIAKGNAAALEWLRSPIVYTGDPAFRDRLLALADEIVARELIERHYLHVGRQQLSSGSSLKRFFYALRPAAALRWLADHPESALPPMDLPTLIAESSVGADIADAVAELIAAKAVTRELGDAARPSVLVRFTEEEFGRAERRDAVLGDPERGARWDEVRALADAWFIEELRAGSRTTR